MPLFRNKFEVPDELLVELRSKFLEELDSEPEAETKYHPDDIERVKENDWYIARYLLHQELNVDNALNMMKKSLQFRLEMGVNTLKEEDFPKSYFESREWQIYNEDKENYPVLAFRYKAHYKNAVENRLQQQFLLFWIEKAVRLNNWGGVSVLFDCTDAGYSNMDIEGAKFMVNTFQHYFPWTMHILLVYNMPWFMSAAWKIIKILIPAKHVNKVVFIDENSIVEYIEKDQLPVCLGGTCTDQYDSKVEKESST